MNIPDNALEPATRQYSLLLTGMDFDAHDMDTRAALEEETLAILKVAAPLVAAQALRDEADRLAEAFPRGRMDVIDFPRLIRSSANLLDPQ